ncbi:snaclec GPIB-binding protein subunit beta-like [Drosophila bipectinata]|uniref:snaclec GPIB-binding protein subunit beta-like n=1 Tax=Drosophila bipectinata TaxID=42026 RepID=UPI001C8AFEF4|nr:perlucin-like protein [Drosophila bipectinata]
MAKMGMKLLALISALCYSFVWATSKAGCPSGFTLMGEKCYYVSREPANWFNADRKCFNMSSSLLIFNDAKEMQLLTSNLQVLGFPFKENCTTDSIWTGLTALGKGNRFVSHRDGGTVEYTPWCANQPNNITTKECAAYANLNEFGYHSIECSSNEFPFVCETKKYNTEAYMCLKKEQYLEVDLEV